jgi:hypothetical protein
LGQNGLHSCAGVRKIQYGGAVIQKLATDGSDAYPVLFCRDHAISKPG